MYNNNYMSHYFTLSGSGVQSSLCGEESAEEVYEAPESRLPSMLTERGGGLGG